MGAVLYCAARASESQQPAPDRTLIIPADGLGWHGHGFLCANARETVIDICATLGGFLCIQHPFFFGLQYVVVIGDTKVLDSVFATL